jgi:hypothetical protein
MLANEGLLYLRDATWIDGLLAMQPVRLGCGLVGDAGVTAGGSTVDTRR